MAACLPMPTAGCLFLVGTCWSSLAMKSNEFLPSEGRKPLHHISHLGGISLHGGHKIGAYFVSRCFTNRAFSFFLRFLVMYWFCIPTCQKKRNPLRLTFTVKKVATEVSQNLAPCRYVPDGRVMGGSDI